MVNKTKSVWLKVRNLIGILLFLSLIIVKDQPAHADVIHPQQSQLSWKNIEGTSSFKTADVDPIDSSNLFCSGSAAAPPASNLVHLPVDQDTHATVFLNVNEKPEENMRAPYGQHYFQATLSEDLIANSHFVWGPADADFYIEDYLHSVDSSLESYASVLQTWAVYSSVNPKVLLTVLEIDYHLVSAFPETEPPEQIHEWIETTSLELASSFYESLYTWGPRRPSLQTEPPTAPAVELQDGSTAVLDSNLNSGSIAIAATLARRAGKEEWLSRLSGNNTDSFSQVFNMLFGGGAPLEETADITPSNAPPADTLQFPYPLGATWYASGAHSWAGGDHGPPFSSLDFFYQGGIPCASPPFHYTVSAAYGDAFRPSDYQCWVQIDHADGWTTSYYHLMHTYSGGTMGQNGSIGTISCEICAGGFATGPHVHFSVKYNGAYVDLEGVSLSGWIVHPGEEPYTSGTYERDGESLEAYSRIMNDYDLYFERSETSLYFYGNGEFDKDRVKIRLHNPARPVDIGDGDMTIEWWLKAIEADNVSPTCVEGNNNWVNGNFLFDRRVDGNDVGSYGISLAGGVIAVGIDNASESDTFCGTTIVTDGEWHHLALTRTSNGSVAFYIDGAIEFTESGPAGDISYPDSRETVHFNDTFLVLGADKFDADPEIYRPFKGWMDEIRFSDNIRYSDAFTPPEVPFLTDASTVGLYHFNEGERNTTWDTSGYPEGPSNGSRRYGGEPSGPEWSSDSPFSTSSPDPVSTWYLAEGYTGAGFQTYILIQNPNDSEANLSITYMLENGDTLLRQHSVGANSRYTIVAGNSEEVGLDKSFATQIDSDQEVFVERTMYFPDGGHNTI
ncbi:MAG: peptidoglycan DD-metalloendopeptidase family protein, partial [Phycisphaerae bacterium]|nr:peptidoglycan DD-metalloendopeptidase family protein [Phycisphaerae bacterium]